MSQARLSKVKIQDVKVLGFEVLVEKQLEGTPISQKEAKTQKE